MTSVMTRNTTLRRKRIGDLQKSATSCDDQKVSQMYRSLTGDADMDLVRERMIERYAQYVVPVKDDASGSTSNELVSRGALTRYDEAARRAILIGQQETIRLYLYPSIVRQRATLFTEPGLRYEYSDGATGDVIGPVRTDANADLAATRWDTFADGIGSCAMLVTDAGGVASYSPILPSQIHVAFAETILDGESERATNEEAIDEATAVVVELAPSAEHGRRWVAYYGPGEEFEDGRAVSYYATNWYDVPPVGAQGALEYSAGARGFVRGATDPINPLVAIASSQGAQGQPVYPIAILRGQSMSSGILPVSSSLYDACGEFDLLGSLVLGAAGRGARGAKLFKRATSTNVPDNVDEGMILAEREQDLINVGWPASHSVDAARVLNEFSRHIAEAHEVPGWLVVADDVAQVPSGVALEIMTQPLTRNRNARIALNRSEVARRFAVERLVVNGAVGSPVVGYDVVETWNPGARSWPRDPEAIVRTWQARISAQEADLADMVQDMRGIASREEAQNFIDARRAEAAERQPEQTAPAVPARPATLAERIDARRAAR